MSTSLVATIISCQQRTESRAVTTRQLEAAWLTPVSFLSPCEPPRSAGNRENALVSARALRHAQAAGGDLLFCEDDINLAIDFPRFLNLARQAKRVTYFYLHDRLERMQRLYGLPMAAAIMRGDPIPAGLHELQASEAYVGAQCIYIPQVTLQALTLGTLEDGRLPIDRWLSRQWEELPAPPLVALPHPVQHRQVRIGRANPTATDSSKYSRSYDLERRWGA